MMVLESDIHARSTARFKGEVMDHAKRRQQTISEYTLTSLRHEMYGRDEISIAIQELMLLREYIDERLEELVSIAKCEGVDIPKVVSRDVLHSTDVSHEVSQTEDVPQDVPQEEVDLKQIQELEDVFNVPTGIALLENRKRYTFTESPKFVEKIAAKSGCTMREFMHALDDAEVEIKWSE